MNDLVTISRELLEDAPQGGFLVPPYVRAELLARLNGWQDIVFDGYWYCFRHGSRAHHGRSATGQAGLSKHLREQHNGESDNAT